MAAPSTGFLPQRGQQKKTPQGPEVTWGVVF